MNRMTILNIVQNQYTGTVQFIFFFEIARVYLKIVQGQVLNCNSVLAREKIKHVGKSEHQSILVVLTHSCYHIKTLFTALARTLW